MGLFGVNLNIKVGGSIQIFESVGKEIVYELEAKHRSRIVKRPLAKFNQLNTAQQRTSSGLQDNFGRGGQ